MMDIERSPAREAVRPAGAPLGRIPPIDFPVGEPTFIAWREATLTRAYELEALCDWLAPKDSRDSDSALVRAIKYHLEAARDAAFPTKRDPHKRFRIFRSWPLMERARANLDAAEAQLLNLAPADYVLGQMPSLLRYVQRNLPPTDPGRQEFERIARSVGINDPDHPIGQNGGEQKSGHVKTIEGERAKIVTTVRAASSEALRERVRLRSFRNIVVITAVLMALLALGVGVIGLLYPSFVPVCFAPEHSGQITVVCPTEQSPPFPSGAQSAERINVAVRQTAGPWDLFTIEAMGLAGALVTAAAAIRNLRGWSGSYGLPLAVAALKLPTGAVTAFLGLLLMRAQFVPGLSALDTSAQILAWALVFGFAQQFFTRFVDQQALTVVGSLRGGDVVVRRVSDKDLMQVAETVDQRVQKGVRDLRASIDDAFAAPALANFTGFLEISAAAHDSEQRAGPGGQIQALPGATVEIDVAIHQTSAADTVSDHHRVDAHGFRTIEPILIEDGVDEMQVSFDVVIDSMTLGITPRRQSVTVTAPAYLASASFRLEVPDQPGEHPASLQLYQAGELIQVVRIIVSASDEPS